MKKPFSEEEDIALWYWRRRLGIFDDDKAGWKRLAAALIHIWSPEMSSIATTDRLATVLIGIPDSPKQRGPKEKWSDKNRADLLRWVDDIKARSSNPNETDQSAIERHGSEILSGLNITLKTLINVVSESRQLAKEYRLPGYTNPDN